MQERHCDVEKFATPPRERAVGGVDALEALDFLTQRGPFAAGADVRRLAQHASLDGEERELNVSHGRVWRRAATREPLEVGGASGGRERGIAR